MIFSMSDEGIDDWEGFFGDMRRGWQLFMASMRFGLTDARTPDRVVECAYFPALGSRDEIGVRVDDALADAEVVAGMESSLAIPPHSRLLTAADRSLLIDIEGSGDKQVLYVQAATHDGPARWRDELLAWAHKEFGDLSPA